jgi:hypothetical protein
MGKGGHSADIGTVFFEGGLDKWELLGYLRVILCTVTVTVLTSEVVILSWTIWLLRMSHTQSFDIIKT